MTKTRIMVVDDNPAELNRTCDLLLGAGYDVVEARDGDEAIAVAVAMQPRLIVVDVILPKKNGFQVCRDLRSDPGTRTICVVLVSAKCGVSDRYWGLRQGADEFLAKPWQDEEFLTVVARQLAKGSFTTGSAA